MRSLKRGAGELAPLPGLGGAQGLIFIYNHEEDHHMDTAKRDGGGNILELRDVSMIYGQVKALQNIDLTVRDGEWLAIMGPSGSGKTTMMNVIGCMDRPSSGSVFLDGQEIAGLSPRALTEMRRDRIGLIFQQFHLISYLTALENVMVAQYYHSMTDETEALGALDRVGLRDRASHLPSQLSGGERQRVCIARALINYPRLILADEPTGNLDEANEDIVLDLLTSLHNEGSTIVLVTHSPEVASRAERTIVLEHGKIVLSQMNDNKNLGAPPQSPQGEPVPRVPVMKNSVFVSRRRRETKSRS
jgi:putative ABC transport system ATP-binding protein